MADFLLKLEHIITNISDAIWPVFLPFILVVGAITSIRTIFIVQKKASYPSTLKLKNAIGPAAISLGAMIGTGAVVGVMGALSKLYAAGQHNIEALAIWALIGALIMVPVSYSETLNSKIMGKIPREYISTIISPKLGMFYAICFVALAVFGFGGFQFSGIDSVTAIVASKFMGIETTNIQRYLFIIVPVIIVVALLVLSKRHEIFMNAMTYMIGTAVALYFIFFTIFVIKTASFIPTYLNGMLEGMGNPVNAMIGVPLGFILGMQKIIQTAETGLGALAMAAQESDSKPREAAMIALIPTIVTVFVAIIVTSYIASYGVRNGIIHFPADTVTRLTQLFETAQDVTGVFGLIVFSIFTVLSALTTILGSYYYMTKLFKTNPINRNIAIYLILVIVSGTLAVFGANVVFEAVDLLLFVLCGINVTTLMIFTFKEWQKYRIDDQDLDGENKIAS